MAGNQITPFIFISSMLIHTHLADNTFSAVMPKTITALKGSCVQIPCTFNLSMFENIRKTASFLGIWLKTIPQYENKASFIAFNSSKNIINGFSDIQMTGNLTERNCTTVFYNIMMNHSDPYYFRLETHPDVFKATFNSNQADSSDSSKTVRISVTDSPKPPELQPKNLSYVMEGRILNLSCSAEAPCPKQLPKIFWSNVSESVNITTQLLENPDKTQSVFSYMTFNVSYRDHKNNISCTVTYPRKTADDSTVETTMMLQVLFSPKETHITIDPSALVSVGTNVTLTCKSKGSPSKNMTYIWYKHAQERPIAQGKKFAFIVTQTTTGSYFCLAQNKHGNHSSSPEVIQLTSDGQSGFSHHVIYGCTGGLLALILLSAAYFYCMRMKTSAQGSNQAMDENRDTVAIYANNTIVMGKKNENKETADLHYGEIDFSNLPTCHMTKECSDNCPQTEYAELQVTKKNKAN